MFFLRRFLLPFIFMLLLGMMLFSGTIQNSIGYAATTNTRHVSSLVKAPFTDQYATVNNVRLHYVIGGKGNPVVLLHGWPETWFEWHMIMPSLALHYRVIVPDLRGAGDSAKPACCYDKKTMAEDIHQLVHHLGYSRIYLVGHDIGGMVSYAYAAAYPQEIRRLVILDVPIPSESFYQLPTLTNPPPSPAWHFGFHAVVDLPEELVTGRERIYLSWFYTHLTYKERGLAQADVNEYVRHYSDPKSLHAGFEWYRAFPKDIKDNTIYAKTKLPMPVLALGGDHSAGTLPLTEMRMLATNVNGGVIPNCGHFIAEEAPDYLFTQLEHFLY